MQANRTHAAVFAIATLFSGTNLATRVALAQAPAPPATAVAASASNYLQRSVAVYGYNAAAKSGATRGEVIYYYKCWNCHNDYTRAAGSPAPALKGIFSRATLVTGDPVDDETVAKQIRNGSPQMPAFGTAPGPPPSVRKSASCGAPAGRPSTGGWNAATRKPVILGASSLTSASARPS